MANELADGTTSSQTAKYEVLVSNPGEKARNCFLLFLLLTVGSFAGALLGAIFGSCEDGPPAFILPVFAAVNRTLLVLQFCFLVSGQIGIMSKMMLFWGCLKANRSVHRARLAGHGPKPRSSSCK